MLRLRDAEARRWELTLVNNNGVENRSGLSTMNCQGLCGLHHLRCASVHCQTALELMVTELEILARVAQGTKKRQSEMLLRAPTWAWMFPECCYMSDCSFAARQVTSFFLEQPPSTGCLLVLYHGYHLSPSQMIANCVSAFLGFHVVLLCFHVIDFLKKIYLF